MASSKECGFTFTWVIENISYLVPQYYGILRSPKFVANCLDKTEWQLRYDLRPNEIDEKIEPYLGLIKVPTEPYYVTIGFEFKVFDANKVNLKTLKFGRCNFHRGDSYAECKVSFFRSVPEIKSIQCRLWKYGTDTDTEQGFGRTRICVERRYFTWTHTKDRQGKMIFMTIDSKKCQSESIGLKLCTSHVSERKFQVVLRKSLTCPCLESTINPCILYPYIQNCEISVVDPKGNVMVFPDQEKWKTVEQKDFKNIPRSKSHDTFYFQFPFKSCNEQPAETFVQNGSISFRCECEICFGIELNQLEDVNSAPIECSGNIEKRQEGCKTATSSGVPPTNFIKDMQRLCADKQFCDFNLMSEKETFPVHRAILSARSPVFKAMFSHDMKENASQSVDVPDLNANTVRRMLLYIYTDNVENILWKDAFDLYIAGDKYQMLDLKERCSSILKSNISPSNVCQILVLADQRHDEDLKRASQDYIVDHDAEIVRLDAWKDIEKNNSKLGVDILRQIVVKRQNA